MTRCYHRTYSGSSTRCDVEATVSSALISHQAIVSEHPHASRGACAPLSQSSMRPIDAAAALVALATIGNGIMIVAGPVRAPRLKQQTTGNRDHADNRNVARRAAAGI